jgi:hypothetical protein
MRLITTGDDGTWLAAGVVCVAALGAYAFTRIAPTLLDTQDVGNWSCMLGLAALFVESLTVVLSGYALHLDAAATQTRSSFRQVS